MAPISNALHRLNPFHRKPKKEESEHDVQSAPSQSQPNFPLGRSDMKTPNSTRPTSAVQPSVPEAPVPDNPNFACPIDAPVLIDENATYSNPYPGLPCRISPIDHRLKCPPPNAADSINTFLRPADLLITGTSVRIDQAKPYLVGSKLVREIPIRDTTKQLSDKELRCLHWIVGESVERHAERTSRYFANLFRSREMTDVIIYVGEHKIKCHKLVLAAFSPRFNKQFMKERPERSLTPEICIDVSQLQTRALLRCIEFMYKGTTEIHHYNAAELLNVAQSLKIFSLAQMCKDKLKSLQFSDLIFKPPKDKCEVIVGELSKPRIDKEARPNKLAAKKSSEDIEKICGQITVVCHNPEEQKRLEETTAVGRGWVDFYKVVNQSTFLAWPVETVEALFGNDEIKLNSELDVVEAMVTWIQFRPDQRRQYAERLLDQVRFIHTTPHEMLEAKHLIPEMFDMGPLRERMSRAKWTKDLVERGVAPADVVIPPCRVIRPGYWTDPDPCDTPIDNIYGVELPREGEGLEPNHRPQKQAARSMISRNTQLMICRQMEAQTKVDELPPCILPPTGL